MVVNNTPLWLQVEFSQNSTGPSAERLEYQSTGSSCNKKSPLLRTIISTALVSSNLNFSMSYWAPNFSRLA